MVAGHAQRDAFAGQGGQVEGQLPDEDFRPEGKIRQGQGLRRCGGQGVHIFQRPDAGCLQPAEGQGAGAARLQGEGEILHADAMVREQKPQRDVKDGKHVARQRRKVIPTRNK